MYKISILLTVFLLCIILAGCKLESLDMEVTSPNGQITVSVLLTDQNQAAYRVYFKGNLLIDTSRLGFVLQDADPLATDLSIVDTRLSAFDETWETVWGEQATHRNHYNELEVVFRENFNDSRIFSLFFRVFDDGLGFRYVIPGQAEIGDSMVILDEMTEFAFVDDHDAWWTPADYDSYEYTYTKSKVSAIDATPYRVNNDRPDRMVANMKAVNTPVTLKTRDGVYISLHEAALIDYPGMTLAVDKGNGFRTELVPWADGTRVKAKLPMKTPWRTIQITPDVDSLIHSSMIMNLNEPSRIKDTDWIEPMVYSGIWWELHIGKTAWGVDVKEGSWAGAGIKEHGATTENAKRYIDFNARHDIRGLLIEGWNTGWESWGRDSAYFDFVSTYPDFDLAAVTEYASSRGIAIIGHNETAGNAVNYDKRIDDAFGLYNKVGIKAVKTGYAGGIYPKGEYHHGQWMVQHYRRVIEKAAEYGIMINAHEPIKDTGERRTWPNMMTREGVRGTEYEAWSEGNPPDHTTILPFTRMLAGPLDYTAGIFDVEFKAHREPNRVHTTLAKQLALMVVLYSPMQMAADLPEHYEGNPALQFISDLVADFSISVVVNGEIGEYITLARKDRNSENWYLGSITNAEGRALEVPLAFLGAKGTYRAVMYMDGDGADWEANPTQVKIVEREISADDTLELTLAPGGGAAAIFELME